MFSEKELKGFNKFLKNLALEPTLYLRQQYLLKNRNKYQHLIDFFFSFGIETKNYNIIKNIQINDFELNNFRQQVGEYLYYLKSNDNIKAKYTFNKLPTFLQNILIATSYFNLTTLLTIDFCLKNIEHYYLLSEIEKILILPKFVDNVFNETIKKSKVSELKLPIYLYSFPKYFKPEKIVYLFKDYDKIKSNIKSFAIRKELLSNILFPKFGILGVLGKDKRYKNKYKLNLIYFNQDIQNVKDLYVGVETEIKNEIDKIKISNFENIIVNDNNEMFNDLDTLKNRLKKLKYSKKFIVLASNGCLVSQFKIEYDNAKVVDYIYNDEFDVIGLKINYENKLYNIYFNVMNTIYVNSIENKFVRIGIVKWFDEIINVFYNSEVYGWDKNYDYCLMCLDIKYKHAYSGLCHHCVNKLKNIAENLSEPLKIKCNRKFNIVVNNITFKADGEYLTCEIPKYYQLALPLFEFDNICH